MACFHYPPFLIDPKYDDKKEGMIVDLLKKMFANHGHEIELKWMNLARAIKSVEEGEIDTICSLNNKRPSKLDLIEPAIARMKVAMWTRKEDNFKYRGVHSIGNRVLGNVLGFVYNDTSPSLQNYLNDEKNKTFVVSGSDPVKRLYQLMEKKRVDLFAINEEYVYYLLGKKYVEDNFRVAGYLRNKLGAYFGVSSKINNKDEIKKIYQTEIQKVHKSKVFLEIYQKYIK